MLIFFPCSLSPLNVLLSPLNVEMEGEAREDLWLGGGRMLCISGDTSVVINGAGIRIK